MSVSRTRWAALGAAVAVTLGAGGVGLVNAAVDSGERTVLVPIEPCRLADTRAGSQIGEETTIEEDSAIVVEAHGEQGECDLPTDATGLAMNVTAVDPSAQTNLRVYPTPDDDSVPLTASLNPFPGLPQEFNGVVTDLNDDGEFSVYNRFGTVDVVIDVVGYYADHTHDDRYYTEEEVDAAIAAASSVIVYDNDIGDTAGVGAATTLASAELTAPALGGIIAESVVTVSPDAGATAITCSLSTDAAIDTDTAQSTGGDTDVDELSAMRAFEVDEGDTVTVNLVCESTGATSTFTNPQLALTFAPTPPAPPVT